MTRTPRQGWTPAQPSLFTPTGRDRTRADFEAFHAAHPEAFDLFLSFVRELRAQGVRKSSARMIVERMRWECAVNPDRHGGFKLNDHIAPHYARLAMERDPALRGFFETRGDE